MARHVTLDVRGLPPPEPFQRVLEAIDGFAEGDTLRLMIDCVPHPLFPILERNGFGHRESPGTDSVYEITIWAMPDYGVARQPV